MHIIGSTPQTPASKVARANLVWDEDAKKELLDKDWRLEEVPYEREPRVPGIACWGDTPGPFPEWVSEALCRKVEDLILNGSSVLAAKHLAGITTKKWQQILQGAREDRDPYRTFLDRLKQAEEHAVVHCERTIAAASEHPDAAIAAKYAQKRLEIMRPGRWLPASKAKLDVTVKGRVEIDTRAVHAIVSMTPEQLAALVSGTLDTNAGRLLLGEEAAPMGASRPDEGDG